MILIGFNYLKVFSYLLIGSTSLVCSLFRLSPSSTKPPCIFYDERLLNNISPHGNAYLYTIIVYDGRLLNNTFLSSR